MDAQNPGLLIDNPTLPPQVGGEPAITCMGAFVANAIFDADGIRFHDLPVNPERKTATAASMAIMGHWAAAALFLRTICNLSGQKVGYADDKI